MADEIIRLENINKSFRSGFLGQKKQVLYDVSFTINKGSVVGFIGGNGAGKSTTMKTMLGLVKADSGHISYFGGQKFTPKHFQNIGFLPERPNFYKFLSGEEFLLYYGKLSQKFNRNELKDRVADVLHEVGLYEAKDHLIGGYSKGMNQRVGIAQALLHRPEFIVLDEPLSGLDPDGRYELGQIIKKAASGGSSILFSSHLLDDTEKICNKIIVIKSGHITYNGNIQDLIHSGNSGYSINYIQDNESKILLCTNQQELTVQIEKLNKLKVNIINIKRNSKSLEEAYVSLVSNENNN